MGAISNIFKKEKEGYATISRIWSDPPPGAPSYYWTYASFDCNIEGRIERITIKLGRFQCKKFVKHNFIGDVGNLVAKGDKLKSWEPVSADQPLSSKSHIKVFMSYSQKWVKDATYIAQFFDSYGLNVWIDKERLNIGDKLNKEIIKEIQSSTYFVPLLSQDYFNSEWCVKEFELAAQSSNLTMLPIKVTEKKMTMPPHFKRIYKDILNEPLFLDIRKKDPISHIKRLAEYIREGRSPLLEQQSQTSMAVDKEFYLPCSLPETQSIENREYYNKRVSAVFEKIKKRSKRKLFLLIQALVVGLIAGGISWFVNPNNLYNGKIVTHIGLPALVVYIIASIFFLLPEYFSCRREIKDEIILSKLDRMALFDLRDSIEKDEDLDDAIKKTTLKLILKELKRSDL